jgi:hypothetical protein
MGPNPENPQKTSMKKHSKSIACAVALATAIPASAQTVSTSAIDSAAFVGTGTQDVSSTFNIRNNFYLNSANALAYLRFEIDSTAGTIAGVPFDDIASVTLDLNVVSFNGSNTTSAIFVWGLNDLIASPVTDGLTETSWTEANFTRATAPHGDTLIDTNDGVLLSTDAFLVGGSNSIALDVNLFKTFLKASSNDEISIPLVGASSQIPTISSAKNSDPALRPALTITASTGQPSSLMVTGFVPVEGSPGVWQMSIRGTAGEDYIFRSAPDLDFSSGAVVENLTAGDPAVGEIGGTNDSVVTTDGGGNATVRMTLTGDPRDFVRAETAP